MRPLNLKGGMGSGGVVWVGQCSTHYSSQQPALEFSQQRDKRPSGHWTPFAISFRKPGSAWESTYPRAAPNQWRTQTPGFFHYHGDRCEVWPKLSPQLPTGSEPWSPPWDGYLPDDPSCFIPLPLGPMSPFRWFLVFCFLFFLEMLHNNSLSPEFCGQLCLFWGNRSKTTALWPLSMLLNLSKPQFPHLQSKHNNDNECVGLL